MFTRGQVLRGRPEGRVLSEEGRSGVFWIWPHKLPRMSLWGGSQMAGPRCFIRRHRQGSSSALTCERRWRGQKSNGCPLGMSGEVTEKAQLSAVAREALEAPSEREVAICLPGKRGAKRDRPERDGKGRQGGPQKARPVGQPYLTGDFSGSPGP